MFFFRGLYSGWRRHPDSNWRIKVLQTFALPLGYGAMPACRAPGVPCLRFFHPAALWGWKDSAPPGFPPQLHNEVNPQNGAVDETRTRDLNLGKVALYQLSYYRVWCLGPESNQRHVDFQSTALPTELPRQDGDPEGARTLDLQRDRLAF